MPIYLLHRLIPIRIIHIGVDGALRLSTIPLVRDFLRPIPGRAFDAGVAGWGDDLHEHEVVIGSEGIGGIIWVLVVDGFGGITFVQDTGSGCERGVVGHALFKAVVDLELGGEVVDLQAGGGGDADFVFLADELVFAVALGDGDARVGDIAGFFVDGVDGVEGGEELFCFLGGAAVGEGPPDDGVCVADGGVYTEASEIDGHVDRGRAVVVEIVECGEDGVALFAAPDVVMIVP